MEMECTSVLVFDHCGVKDNNSELVHSNKAFERKIKHRTPTKSDLNATNALTPGNDEKLVHWYTVAKKAEK